MLESFRIHFTHGTSVSKSLECCPPLPIVLQYGGSLGLDPPTPEDERNILTALQQIDRVVSISLTISRSLLERLHAIERPFPELEVLVLLSQDDERLTLPNAFRCGSRLRCLRSTGIVFPSLLQLLHSSRNLVDLDLHKVGSFSPTALTHILSGMTQLRTLSLHILSTILYSAPPAPTVKRVILPALIHLGFRGKTEYLPDLVTRIDAPRLGYIDVVFSTVKTSELSALSEFIGRVGIHRSHRRADIISSDNAISISLTRTGTPGYLQFQLFCPPLALQLSSIALICVHFSAFLLDVEDLRINVRRRSRWEEDSLSIEQWLEPINLFTGVKWFHVAGNLSTQIVRALQQPENAALSALQELHILQPGPSPAPLREAVVSFMVLRRLSGHPIGVEYERLSLINELRETGAMHAPCLHHSSLTRLV
jgi:hypothetical protein